MKVFYFGSVCSNDIFNETVAKSKVKPSSSAQNFENALIKGFDLNGVDLTVASAESIATFPGGNRLFLKSRRDQLTDRYETDIISAINLPFLKQVCHAYGAEKLLKRWLEENRDNDNKCVLAYGIYPAVVKRLQRICKQYGCKIIAVVTDVPSTMFTYTKSKNLLKRMFSSSYREAAIAVQDKFDGYVYLTEAMEKEVAPGKPYIVIETIADTTIFDSIGNTKKADPPALMYAGALYKKYGVDRIVEAFEQITTECELWLFGSGDYEEEIIKKAKHNPKIKFFGRVSRDDVLIYERKAMLLLNIRNDSDKYTKFSFPSKMAEYMLSGTPMLTTRLDGIPAEYYYFTYSISGNSSISELAAEIDQIISQEPKELNEKGLTARKYIMDRKNSRAQTRSICNFLNSL